MRLLQIGALVAAMSFQSVLSQAQSASVLCSPSNLESDTTYHAYERVDCAITVQGVAFPGRTAYTDVKIRAVFHAQPTVPPTDPPPSDVVTFAFWDGTTGSTTTFRFRTMLPVKGQSINTWTWTTFCDAGTCAAAAGKTGSLSITAVGTPTFYSKGLLERDVTSVSCAEGTCTTFGPLFRGALHEPFRWLADTAWVGPMKATTDTVWSSYLSDRVARGFTVVQVGPAPRWGCTNLNCTKSNGQSPFIPEVELACGAGKACSAFPNSSSMPNPLYWQNFERRIEQANQAGLWVLVAGLMEPVAADGACNIDSQYEGKRYPTQVEAQYFARYLASRLAGNMVVFSPGWDSPPVTCHAIDLKPRINGVAAEVQSVAPRHLLTNHWGSVSATEMQTLHDRPWLSFQMFQSGMETLTKLTDRAFKLSPQLTDTSLLLFRRFAKTNVNGEAVYDEGALVSGDATNHHNAFRARQAAYYSLLSGAQGATFGIGGLWDWGRYSFAAPYGNSASAVTSAGSVSAKIFNYFASVDSDRLVPENARIRNQQASPENKFAVARSTLHLMAYIPRSATSGAVDFVQVSRANLPCLTCDAVGIWKLASDDSAGGAKTLASVPSSCSCADPLFCEFNNPFDSALFGQSDVIFLVELTRACKLGVGAARVEDSAAATSVEGSGKELKHAREMLLGEHLGPGEQVASILTSSGFLAAWSEPSKVGEKRHLRVQQYDERGEAIGAAAIVERAASAIEGLQLAKVSGDSTLLVWTEVDEAGEIAKLVAQPLTSLGVLLGDTEDLYISTRSRIANPLSVELLDGTIGIVWTESETRLGLISISAARLGSSWRFLSEPEVVGLERAAEIWPTDIELLPAGRMKVSWELIGDRGSLGYAAGETIATVE